MKQFALVDLKGGLGNQIFQIAYALYLKSLNIATFIDTHFYSSNMQFPRKLEIMPTEFGFKSISLKNTRVFSKFGTLFAELNTFNNEDFRTFNRFVGYYQDFNILDYSKNIFQEYLQLGNNLHHKNKVAVHIRRGDYIELQQNLSDLYYKDAVNKILSKNSDSVFDIYTDAEHLDLNLNIFKNVENVYTPDMDINSIEALKKMSEYSNYIIANSSFSALAAYFSKSSKKTVIYPTPWWRESNIRILNIPNSWTPVGNKL